MRRLRYSALTRHHLEEIITYIAERSGDVLVGRRFAALLRQQCHKLASLPGVLGQPRPELGAGLRSYPFRNYVIFFRYARGRFEVIGILERHRDVEAYFTNRFE